MFLLLLHLKQATRPVQIPPLPNQHMRIPHCRFRLSLGQNPTHLLNRQVLRKPLLRLLHRCLNRKNRQNPNLRPPLRLLQPQPLKLNHLKPLPFQNRPRKPQRLLPAQRLSGLRMRVMKPQRGARTLLRFLLIPPLSTPITNLALSPCVSVVSTVRALVAL